MEAGSGTAVVVMLPEKEVEYGPVPVESWVNVSPGTNWKLTSRMPG
jgi:hypothetical protein